MVRPARLAATAALGVCALLSCVDGSDPTGLSSGGVASLAVVPRFDAAAAPAGGGLSINRIHVVGTLQPPGTVVLDTLVEVADQDSWELTLSIAIPEGGGSVVLTIELIHFEAGTSTVEWSGQTSPIELVAGQASTIKTVQMVRGPVENLAVTSVQVSPDSATLTEGDSLRLTATTDPPDAVVYWASLDTTASVSASGMVSAHLPGAARIVGIAGARADTARVLVRAIPVGVDLDPDTVHADTLGTIASFAARVVDARGDSIAGYTFAWRNLDTIRLADLGGGRFRVRRGGVAHVLAVALQDTTLRAQGTVVTALASVDVAVVKTVDADTVFVGDTLTYTVTALSEGDARADSIVVRDSLPRGLTLVGADAGVGVYDAGTGLWSIVALEPTTSATLVLRAVVDTTARPGSIVNVAALMRVALARDSIPENDTASAATFVAQRTADVSIGKVADRAQAFEGDTVTFTMVLANAGPWPATDLVVEDSLPAGLRLLSARALLASVEAAAARWTLDTLSVGAVDTLVLVARVDSGTAEASLLNRVRVLPLRSEVDPDSTDNSAEAIVSVGVKTADVAVSKTLTRAGPFFEGDTVTFAVAVSNAGAYPVEALRIADVADSALARFAHRATRGTFDTLTLTWSLPTLAPGASDTLLVGFAVDSATFGDTLVNRAAVSTLSGAVDVQPANDAAAATLVVERKVSSLAVGKTLETSGPYYGGDTVRFAVTVTNAGPWAATALRLLESPDSGLVIVGHAETSGVVDTLQGTWTLDSLAAGGADTLKLTAVVDSGSVGLTLANRAFLEAYHGVVDTVAADDADSVTVTIASRSVDLSVTKVVDRAAPSPGDTVTYTIAVKNGGPALARGLVLQDELQAPPGAVGVVGITATRGTVDTLAMTWSLDSLAVAAQDTLRVSVRIDAAPGSTILNVARAPVPVGHVDPDTLNNVAAVPVTVSSFALGDTLIGSIDVVGEEFDTLYLRLEAGAVVDLGVFAVAGSSLLPRLWVHLPDGNALYGGVIRTGGTIEAAILPGFVVPTSGTYVLVVQGYGWPGGYVVKTRTSGAVLASEPSRRKDFSAPAGSGTLVDTLWVFNAGRGSVDFEVVSHEPRVSVSPASGTLPEGGPVLAAAAVDEVVLEPPPAHQDRIEPLPRPRSRDRRMPAPAQTLAVFDNPALAPPGSVQILVTMDAVGMDEGWHWFGGALELRTPTDTWSGSAFLDVELTLYNPETELVRSDLPYFTSDVGLLPDGGLVVAAGGSLWRVDPSAGTRTLWAGGLTSEEGLWNLDVGADGSVYVADWGGGGVLRVQADGTTSRLAASITDPVSVAVHPDGRVYVTDYYTGLWELSGGGATNVATPGANGTFAVAYSPVDGGIYFSYALQLHRYDPDAGTTASVGLLDDWALDLAVGATGRWYVRDFNGISVYDAALEPLEGWTAPDDGYSLTLADGWVYGTTEGWVDEQPGSGILFRLPVEDQPPAGFALAKTVENAVPARTQRTRFDVVLRNVETATSSPATVVDTVPAGFTIDSLESRGGTVTTAGSIVTWVRDTLPALGADTLRIFTTVDELAPVGPFTNRAWVEGYAASASVSGFVMSMLVGDTLPGSIDAAEEADTFHVYLEPGQRMDIAVVAAAQSMLFPAVEVFGPLEDPEAATYAWNGGSPRIPATAIIPNFGLPGDGTYAIVVKGQDTGAYELRTRNAGAFVVTEPEWTKSFSTPASPDPVTDTIWISNAGAVSATFEIVSHDLHLTVSPSSGTVDPLAPAPLAMATAEVAASTSAAELRRLRREEPRDLDRASLLLGRIAEASSSPVRFFQSPALAPEGAVPIEVTFWPSGLHGYYEMPQALEFRTPSDPWFGSAFVSVEAWVYDPAVEVLAQRLPFETGGVDALPDGTFAVAAGGDLWRVDPLTGAATVWVQGLSADVRGLRGVETAPDGSVYVTRWDAGVARVAPDGTVEAVATGLPAAYDVTLLPDGRLFIADLQTGLWERTPDGTLTNVASAGADNQRAVAYHPLDEGVYFGRLGELHRFDLRTRTSSVVASFDFFIVDLAFGASGRMYVRGNWDQLATFDASLEEVSRSTLPGTGYAVTLVDGWIYGTTWGAADDYELGTGRLFRLPVEDGPPSALTLQKAAVPIVVAPGEAVRFDIVLRNLDATASAAATVVDTVPGTFTVTGVESTGSTPSFSGGVVTWAAGSLPGLGADTLRISATLDQAAAAGTYENRAWVGGYAVPASVTGSIVSLAAGGSLAGSIDLLGEADTFYVHLEPSEPVDFAVVPAEGSSWRPGIALYRPDGSPWLEEKYGRRSGEAVFLPGVAAPSPGLHMLVVFGAFETTGGYVLKERGAGPIVEVHNGWYGEDLSGPAAGPVVQDTMWVFNMGTGAADFSVTSAQSWLSVSPADAILPLAMAAPERSVGASTEPDPSNPREPALATRVSLTSNLASAAAIPPPESAIPVYVTADVSGFSPGVYDYPDALEVSLPSDPWGGSALVNVRLIVSDAGVSIVVNDLPSAVRGLDVLPSGHLVVGASGSLWDVDPVTRAKTVLAADVSSSYTGIEGVGVASDGSVYVADYADGGLVKHVLLDGTVEIVASGITRPSDLAVAPGDIVYVLSYETGLWRIAPDGVVANLSTSPGCYGLHHSAIDGGVYLGCGVNVVRYDPAYDIETTVASVGESVEDLTVGASGNWYVRHRYRISVRGPEWTELASVVVPQWGNDILLAEGMLYGTTSGVEGFLLDFGVHGVLFSYPVDDAPYLPPPSVAVPREPMLPGRR